eukprot:UN30379
MQRRLSNSEAKMALLGGYHVNQKVTGKINLNTPGSWNHSYNAVGFNIHGLPGGYVIRVNGFGVEGDLGRMRIYAAMNENCHDIRLTEKSWKCVYDKKHAKSFNRQKDMFLDEPVYISPKKTCAFYIHSDCQTDRGLKYRSCKAGVVMKDNHIAITHGYAHTSPIPFHRNLGWFRNNRVLSGSVYYEAVPIMWSNYTHWDFPESFQRTVHVVHEALMQRNDSLKTENIWTTELVQELITFFPLDWFGNIEEDKFTKALSRKYNRHGHNDAGW